MMIPVTNMDERHLCISDLHLCSSHCMAHSKLHGERGETKSQKSVNQI